MAGRVFASEQNLNFTSNQILDDLPNRHGLSDRMLGLRVLENKGHSLALHLEQRSLELGAELLLELLLLELG